MAELTQLMQQLNYQFNDVSLLTRALSHRSLGAQNNERLEFLGDSVLGCAIAHELYHRYPDASEGELSRLRAYLVNGERLAELARSLGVSDYLLLGFGEAKSGGKKRRSILANALEAIIGAIYLDAGFSVVQRCVVDWFGDQVNDLSDLTPDKDAKSQLQEWAQARKKPLPTYAVVVSGEAHAQTFAVTCSIDGLPQQTQGVSSSRRKAEQLAAARYLELLDE